jgi:hypothetical protein
MARRVLHLQSACEGARRVVPHIGPPLRGDRNLPSAARGTVSSGARADMTQWWTGGAPRVTRSALAPLEFRPTIIFIKTSFIIDTFRAGLPDPSPPCFGETQGWRTEMGVYMYWA